MMNDVASLHERLDRMISEDPNGAQANDLLHRLTVFQGPFDAAAAVALAPRDMPEVATLAALVTLQQWGLLGRVAVSEPLPIEARVLEAIPSQAETFATLQAWGFLERETVPTRYFLLKSILRALPPDEDALTRHYEYYRRLHRHFPGIVEREHYPLVSADWPNIRAALVWGMSHTRTVFDLAWALNLYMQDCLARADWREMIEGLLRVAQKQNNVEQIGNMFAVSGTIAHLDDALSRAQSLYTEALACYAQVQNQSIGNSDTSAKVLHDLWALGDRYETTRDVYDHLLALPRFPYRQIQQIIVLYHLHDVQTKRGDFADARDLLLQIMDLYQRLRDEQGQCDTLTNMGITAVQAGDLAQARDDFAWALRMGEQMSYSIGRMKTLWAWGQAEYQNGQKEAGCALCRQAIGVIMAAVGVQDQARAEELRRQLANMDCGANIDGE